MILSSNWIGDCLEDQVKRHRLYYWVSPLLLFLNHVLSFPDLNWYLNWENGSKLNNCCTLQFSKQYKMLIALEIAQTFQFFLFFFIAVSLSKKLYPYCLVLVCHRNRLKLSVITCKDLFLDQAKNKYVKNNF